MLSGDAGLGKSRLLAALHDITSLEPHMRVQFQCSPIHMDSAFYPISRQLERAAKFVADDTDSGKLDKLAALIGGDEHDCLAVATIMSLRTDGRFDTIELTPQQLKLQAIEASMRHVSGLAAGQPVLMTFEDLHWIDPSSEELLIRMIAVCADMRLLIVMTHRPEYEPPFPPADNLSEVALTYLGRAEIDEMVQAVAGQNIDPT